MNRNMRLTVETPTGGGNFSDSAPQSWETYSVGAFAGTEWFLLMPLSGREFEQAQQVQSNVTHKAECAWFAGAHSRMRLREAGTGRTWEVASVVNRAERNRILDWMLIENG